MNAKSPLIDFLIDGSRRERGDFMLAIKFHKELKKTADVVWREGHEGNCSQKSIRKIPGEKGRKGARFPQTDR